MSGALDCIAAETLLPMASPETMILHCDKGYESNRFRRMIEAQGAAPNNPPKSNRRYRPGFSLTLYRKRNAVGRSFCRLKNFRRIATQYERLARNFLAAIQLTATGC